MLWMEKVLDLISGKIFMIVSNLEIWEFRNIVTCRNTQHERLNTISDNISLLPTVQTSFNYFNWSLLVLPDDTYRDPKRKSTDGSNYRGPRLDQNKIKAVSDRDLNS